MAADFLKAAKQNACEIIDIAGIKIEVRGLSVKDLATITRPGKGEAERDPQAMTTDLIAACLFYPNGARVIPDDRKAELNEISPIHYRALNEAVGRVNGFLPGNFKATDAASSSSA